MPLLLYKQSSNKKTYKLENMDGGVGADTSEKKSGKNGVTERILLVKRD